MSSDCIITRLQAQELGLPRCNYRYSLLTLRLLIKDPGSSYHLVWYKESKSPIHYNDRKILFADCSEVYSLYGANGRPSLQYRLPEKIGFEEVIVLTTKINRLPVPGHLFAPLFVGLTRGTNRLIRYNAHTGKKLNTIFLGKLFTFKHMSWQVTGETMLLQSPYSPAEGCLRALAFVAVNPFKFGAMIELTTDLVGTDAKTVNVGNDILWIGCPGKRLVRLYSMRDVLSEDHADRLCCCDFGQSCTRAGAPPHGRVGGRKYGLPITHKIRTMPPVLFEIKTDDPSTVNFGGFPYHYLSKHPGKGEIFRLMDLMTDRLVQTFDREKTQCDTDKFLFHEDESGRIVLVRTDTIHVLKFRSVTKCEVRISNSQTMPIKVEEGDTYDEAEVETQFVLRPLPDVKSQTPVLTVKQENISPNRPSRPRRAVGSGVCTADRAERPLLRMHYENEMEFLSILGIAEEDQSSSVCIFDNSDGSFVKRISVPKLEEEDTHKLIVDMDHVIHIVKKEQRNCISVYQLKRSCETTKLVIKKTDNNHQTDSGGFSAIL